jgi:diguanylate cyclase (GGDEF)-like protein/PAS domain S-box-containing protein
MMASMHEGNGGRLQAARVATLFEVARPAYVATLANASILLVALWEPIPELVLISWFAVLAAMTLARIAIQRQYQRAAGAGKPELWERRFAIGALAAGAVWALPPAVFFSEIDALRQMAVVFVVGGSIIGAAGVYAPSVTAFYGFCTLPFLAVMLQLATQTGRTYQLLALMVLVFGGVIVRVFRDINGNVIRTLRTQIENQTLLERLSGSEALLRDAIESYPDGIAIYDGEDRLAVCNAAYAKVYGAGLSAAELAGTPYARIAENAFDAESVAPEYLERREAWIEERMQRRRAGSGEVRQYRTHDGGSLLGRFVRSRSGIVSVFTDVSELRAVQDAYEKVLAERNLMLDTLPAGVAFVGHGVILRCNRRLEQMLGYAHGELDGKSSRALYASEAQWKAIGEELEERLRGGGIAEWDAPLARKDGMPMWSRSLGRALDPGRPEEGAIYTFTDASERLAAERELRNSEAMYRSLVETSNDLIWSIDAAGRWTYLNPAAAERIYGCPAAELIGREYREQIAQEVRERDLAVFRRILAGESVFNYETRHLRRDGAHVDLAFNAIPLRDPAGAITGATGTAHDISEQKRAAAALHEGVERLRLGAEAADLHYWEWDSASDTMFLGHTPAQSPGAPGGMRIKWSDYLNRVHPEDRERFVAAARAALEWGEPLAAEFRIEGEDGQQRWFAARGKALADGSGQMRRVIGVSQDITERKSKEEEARFLAYHDTLTGLPNRRLLDDRLRQALFAAQRRDARVAVMMVDLDRFKQVNDALGHRAGDSVLREVAHRLTGCVRKADTLARHGGDEFVVVFSDLQLESDCQVVAEKILRALEAPFRVDGQEFTIGASIGISLFPADATDGEALLRNADVAMYRAKQLGANNYRFYSR